MFLRSWPRSVTVDRWVNPKFLFAFRHVVCLACCHFYVSRRNNMVEGIAIAVDRPLAFNEIVSADIVFSCNMFPF